MVIFGGSRLNPKAHVHQKPGCNVAADFPQSIFLTRSTGVRELLGIRRFLSAPNSNRDEQASTQTSSEKCQPSCGKIEVISSITLKLFTLSSTLMKSSSQKVNAVNDKIEGECVTKRERSERSERSER